MTRQIDPHDLLKTILQGTAPPRPLFLPIVFSHAARIENLPLRAFLANPTKITQGLRQIRAHLRPDGLTCYFDPYLEIEALGGLLEWGSTEQPSVRWTRNSLGGDLPEGLRTMDELSTRGRIPVAVEVIRRLKSLVRDECLLMAGISGPFALAAQLMQATRDAPGGAEISASALKKASEAIAPIAKAFVEAGANVIFVREELPPSGLGPVDLATLLATTINIVRFYEAIPVLLLGGEPRSVNLALQQSLDCVVSLVQSETLPNILKELVKPEMANFGIAIPASVVAEPEPRFEKFAEKFRRLIQTLQPALITTSGDVPPTTDLRNLNKLRDLPIA